MKKILSIIIALILIAAAGFGVYHFVASPQDSGHTAAVDGDITDADPTNQDSADNTAEASSESAPITVKEISDAPYEHWLAALIISGISMNYADFEPADFYTNSETALGQNTESGGVYLTFTSEGTDYTAYAYPIDAERTEAGTMDLYSAVTGYAALDITEGTDIPSGYTACQMDDVNTLIEESSQVLVYTH